MLALYRETSAAGVPFDIVDVERTRANLTLTIFVLYRRVLEGVSPGGQRMSKGRKSGPSETRAPPVLSHLRRETRTALELAVVALAPSELVERLATLAGLFEALHELPPDSPPVMALVPTLTRRAKSALEDWQQWQTKHLGKAKA
jgi:hypothetical protein